VDKFPGVACPRSDFSFEEFFKRFPLHPKNYAFYCFTVLFNFGDNICVCKIFVGCDYLQIHIHFFHMLFAVFGLFNIGIEGYFI